MAEVDADTIAELAAGPKRVTGDEGTVEERSVREMIDADRYAKSQDISDVPYGLRIAKMKFPGTP